MKRIRFIFIFISYFLFPKGISAQGTWVQVDSITPWNHYTMESGVGFSINGKGYYALGDTSLCTYSKELWEYDPIANVWSQKADYMGTARTGAVAFVVNNIGYVGLGYDRITGSQNSFYSYNPITNSWAMVASLPATGRVYPSSFVIGNKGYIGNGGYYNGLTGYCDTVYKELWEYTPLTNTWLRKNDFPGDGRLNAISWSIAGKGYWGTGVTIDTSASVSNDLWEYTPTTDSWVQMPNYPFGDVYAAVGFSIGNYGYITCGMSFSSVIETWQFNPSTNTWTRMADFPDGDRALAVGFTIGQKGYMVGGIGTVDAWSFDPGNVGFEESVITNDVNIYPNPFVEYTTLEIENFNKEAYEFSLYDLNGSLVLNQQILTSKTILPRNNFASGVYIWKVFDNKKNIASGKITIK